MKLRLWVKRRIYFWTIYFEQDDVQPKLECCSTSANSQFWKLFYEINHCFNLSFVVSAVDIYLHKFSESNYKIKLLIDFFDNYSDWWRGFDDTWK